jgi:cell division protein FtsZ
MAPKPADAGQRQPIMAGPAPAQEPERKRSGMSLFGLVTGLTGRKAEPAPEVTHHHQPAPQPAPQMAQQPVQQPMPQMAQPAPQPEQRPASFSIEVPGKPMTQGDQDLEIPAFLRRQAN